MPGDWILGISCNENASVIGGQCPPDPLPGLLPGPNAFLIFRQLYCAFHHISRLILRKSIFVSIHESIKVNFLKSKKQRCFDF